MKRLFFLLCKLFVITASLLSSQNTLCAMRHNKTVWDSMPDDKKIEQTKNISAYCDTYERYMKIEFIERLFIKNVLSRIREEINGLELQYVSLWHALNQPRRHKPRRAEYILGSDGELLLKQIEAKITQKYCECEKLWQAHEQSLGQLLTLHELEEMQKFSQSNQSLPTKFDVNQQIFAQLDPDKIKAQQDPDKIEEDTLEINVLRELKELAQNDSLWRARMDSSGLTQYKKHHSGVCRYIQSPKQIILGIIFNAAKDGCPNAQEFVRYYKFDFVLFPEPKYDAQESSAPAPSTLSAKASRSKLSCTQAYSTPTPSTLSVGSRLVPNQKKLNPDAPVFEPRFMFLSSTSAQPVASPEKPVAVLEVLSPKLLIEEQHDKPAEAPAASVTPAEEVKKTETHGDVVPEEESTADIMPAEKAKTPEIHVNTSEVLQSKVGVEQQSQAKPVETQALDIKEKKVRVKKFKRKKEKEPIKEELVEQRHQDMSDEKQSSDSVKPDKKHKRHKEKERVQEESVKCESEMAAPQASKQLSAWSEGVRLIRSREIRSIHEGIKLLEPLFLLIPGRRAFDRRDLVGVKEVIKILQQNVNDKFVTAFLIRLGVAIDFNNAKKLIQKFVIESSSIRDSSIQSLIAYIHDKGLNGTIDSMQAVSYWIQALANPSIQKHIKDEVIYFLQKKGQYLFDINFQTQQHKPSAYPEDNRNTLDLISACYALVPALISSDSLTAARMFIAAENTVVFLYDKQPKPGLVTLPSGIAAQEALQEFVLRTRNLDALAALIFSYLRRYDCGIVPGGLQIDLAEWSKIFLENAMQYFSAGDFSNQKRSLLIGLSCNMYCIFSSRPAVAVPRRLLIDLMQGVVRACPESHWFFKYNCILLIAGSSEAFVMKGCPYRSQIQAANHDALLGAMIIKDLTKEASWLSWCSIL